MAQQALFAYITKDYSKAENLYNQYLTQNPNDYQILVARSALYYTLGKFEDAIKDSDKAIVKDRSRYEAYFQRGQANFAYGRVEAALIDFEDALSKKQDLQNILSTYIRKCQAQLEDKRFQPTKQQETKQQEKQMDQENNQAKRNEVQSSTGKVIYRWYQTDNKIGIEINQTLDKQEKLNCKFQDKKIEVSFPLEDGGVYDLNLDLFAEINPSNSKGKVGFNQIEIIMEKKQKSYNWLKLEADELQEEKEQVQEQEKKKQQEPQRQNPHQTAAYYPSSSKVKKDWSKIDKEIEEDMQKNKEEYGEDPLNSVFKEIYKNADENTRRAMIKSMQTSGGTVLSTNWDEVKAKDYEGKDRPSPPKGQERKEIGK